MIDIIPSILIFSGVRGDTRRYRSFHLYEQTRLLGLDSYLSHVTDREFRKKVEHSSIVFLHRAAYNKQIAWLEREIHQNNGLLIQDIDDLLFEPNAFKYIQSIDFSDPVRSTLYQEEMHLYYKTLQASDFVTTSTGYLAERVRELGKPVKVHRNAFSLEMLDRSEKFFQTKGRNDSGIVTGYASGTPTHNQDFALIKPALISILNHFSNVELWLVGPVDPGNDWGNFENRIRHLNLVPWRDLPEILARFDINLAPLRTDNPFGQSKSEIKYMEAALVRVPTIASPSDAFKSAIKHADTGFLASDVPEWEYSLETLICQPELRQHMGQAAFQDVMNLYHPAVRAKELIEILTGFVGNKYELSITSTPDVNLKFNSTLSYWSSAQAEKFPSLLQMGLYTIRYRGLLVLLKQIWIYLRRLTAPFIPYK